MLTLVKIDTNDENDWTDHVVDGLGLATEDWWSSTMIWHTWTTSKMINRSPGTVDKGSFKPNLIRRRVSVDSLFNQYLT